MYINLVFLIMQSTHYYKGQKLLHIGRQLGKPEVAYICSDPEQYLIKLGASADGSHPFWVNKGVLSRHWRTAEKGIQLALFEKAESGIIQSLKQKHLKQHQN